MLFLLKSASQMSHCFKIFKFLKLLDAGQALHEHLVKQCQTYHLQAAIFKEALLTCFPVLSGAESKLLLEIPFDQVNFSSFHIYVSLWLPVFGFLPDKSTLNNGNGIIKRKAAHIPLMSRPTERKSSCIFDH